MALCAPAATRATGRDHPALVVGLARDRSRSARARPTICFMQCGC